MEEDSGVGQEPPRVVMSGMNLWTNRSFKKKSVGDKMIRVTNSGIEKITLAFGSNIALVRNISSRYLSDK